MNNLKPNLFLLFLMLHFSALAKGNPCNPTGTSFPSSGDVTIKAGETYVIDKSHNGNTYGAIAIHPAGALLFKNENISITVNNIMVMGTMQIGGKNCPISGANTVEIKFTGSAVKNGLGIMVMPAGTLEMVGERGVEGKGVSWTHLSQPAGPPDQYGANNGVAMPVTAPDAKTLFLADDVDWRAGDWIVVATTDFTSHHSEFVKIKTVTSTGNNSTKVTLDDSTPLLFYHFGSPPPSANSFKDDFTTNYGVDERAEVGLISRNIRLTTTITQPQFGGNIMIMPAYSSVIIEGVELEKFGQPVKGKYPIHFHIASSTPTPTNTTINSNSIHHTFNKCITVHLTNGLNIKYNVCARNIGHSYFLETGMETDNLFEGNLAVGAMAAGFKFPADSANVCTSFWEGDYMVKQSNYAYDGMNVPHPEAVPGIIANENKTPTGFWITNPNNSFLNNSVAGVQGLGRGFWILPVANAAAAANKAIMPLFKGNRAHACFNGFDNATDDGVSGFANWTPTIGRPDTSVVVLMEDIISTRNRNRGIWLRPSWAHVHNARMAMNRQSLSLVSSGGVEGSPPGVWQLATDCVFVGISTNNVERWGPCLGTGTTDCLGNTFPGNGFIDPTWNLFGYMFYDGPARLESCRFINFNKDISPYLTAKDRTLLEFYQQRGFMTSGSIAGPEIPYEGDAGLGWFQSNVNAYPPTQYVKDLTFDNCDFKHQVYTEHVNKAIFADGDKNTVILDLDGSLSDFVIIDTTDNTKVANLRYPVSLNNLPFLGTPYTVDECHSIGAQNEHITNRESSLMSPHDYATLETTVWYAQNTIGANGKLVTSNNNVIRFQKDMKDYGEHQEMTLVGRNFQGVYEPKVMDKLGYILTPTVKGLPNYISLGLIDVRKPEVTTESFMVRVGICYKTNKGMPVDTSEFTVERGRKSYGQINASSAVYKNMNAWVEQDDCHDLTETNPGNKTNCPADKIKIPAAKDWTQFTSQPGDTYFYDDSKGILFLYIEQEVPNASAHSPLSNCSDCLYNKFPYPKGFDFYPCPPGGCFLYTIRTTKDYSHDQAADCDCYTGPNPDGNTNLSGYEQEYPKFKHQLAYSKKSNGGFPLVPIEQFNNNSGHAAHGNFPYNKIKGPAPADFCPTNPIDLSSSVFKPKALDGNIGIQFSGGAMIKLKENGTDLWVRPSNQSVNYINIKNSYTISASSGTYQLSFSGTNSSGFTPSLTGGSAAVHKVAGGVQITGL